VPLDELEEATASFADERLVGVGGFGRVYYAPRLPSLAATRAAEQRPAALGAGLMITTYSIRMPSFPLR